MSPTIRFAAIALFALPDFFVVPFGHADPPPVTDAAVEHAIQQAVARIKSRKNNAGHWQNSDDLKGREWGGDTALAVLALLYAGENPAADDMARVIDWLAGQPLNGTYAHGVRAHALALIPGTKYRQRLMSDLEWLVRAPWPRGRPAAGAYGYEAVDRNATQGWWDNSNSQYGVLGVWMATDAGASVANEREYWELMRDHWLRTQRPDGGWGYNDTSQSESNGSMTAAGLASVFVVLDRLAQEGIRDDGTIANAIDAGLGWLAREFTPDNPRGESRWKYYYLYGIERVGRASGYKYFRGRDWFREGAASLLDAQQVDGGWLGSGDPMSDLRNTAFAVMFLSHGRAPLTFNKLQHADDWNLKRRDIAGLTWFSEQALERLLNWQIVPLEGPLEDLFEAPVLYLSGESAWTFDNAQVQKLREYCERGGFIFAVASRNSADFTRSIRDLAERAFPEFPVRPVNADHPLVSGAAQYKIEKPPLMFEIHNGVRTLMLWSQRDIADAWGRYRTRGDGAADYQLGCNVYVYATDKSTRRSRLDLPAIPQQQVDMRRTIRLARVRHGADWNIEPSAWQRLARYMNNTTATRLLVTSGVALESADLAAEFDVLHITGTQPFALSEAEQRGLRRYLTSGGTLLADAAMGSEVFLQSFEEQVGRALAAEPRVVPENAAILTGGGILDAVDLDGAGYRRLARGAPAAGTRPRLKGIAIGRRYAVLYSPLDMSVSLLGTDVFGCRGFDAPTALSVMRNLLLYATLKPAEKAKLFGDR